MPYGSPVDSHLNPKFREAWGVGDESTRRVRDGTSRLDTRESETPSPGPAQGNGNASQLTEQRYTIYSNLDLVY